MGRYYRRQFEIDYKRVSQAGAVISTYFIQIYNPSPHIGLTGKEVHFPWHCYELGNGLEGEALLLEFTAKKGSRCLSLLLHNYKIPNNII